MKKEFIWTDALNIDEKYNILKNSFKSINTDYNNFQEWKERKSLLGEDSYDKILEELGYEQSFFTNAIKKDSKELQKIYIKELDKYPFYNFIVDLISSIETDDTEYSSDASLTFIIRPYLHILKKRLDNYLENLKFNLNKEKIKHQLLDALNIKLLNISLKTIVLEINIFKENNTVLGDSEKDRYDYIVSSLGKKENLILFFQKYPTLTRCLSEITINFEKNLKELINNLYINENTFKDFFKLDISDSLESIKFDLGDTHQGGKTVNILTFKSGTKIVYKPKELEIINSFNKLIDYINNNRSSNLLDMPKLKQLVFESFCLEEFVENIGCTSINEIKNFYKRLGQSTAIMYMLRGNDFHMENLIAKGEYPIFVDLETLLHNNFNVNYNYDALNLLHKITAENVTNTSLLPTKNFFIEKGVSLDLSALNGKAQDLPIKMLKPVNLNTDNIRYQYGTVTLPASKNLPTINDTAINYKDYLFEFKEGFKFMCLFFLNNKNVLLNKIYPEFNEKKVRILIRNTKNYANIIESICHPRYLQNHIDKEKVLENIWAFPLENRSLIRSEYDDLKNYDIPIFFNKTNSRDLIDSKNRVYKNFFQISSYELIKNKLIKLDMAEILNQLDIIKIYTEDIEERDYKNNYDIDRNITLNDIPNCEENNSYFLNEAILIGDQVLDTGIFSNKDNTYMWLHLAFEKSGKLDFIDGSFYNGLSGFVLYYFYLYQETNNNKYNIAYRNLIDSSLKLFNGLTGTNVVTGKASLLYPLYKIYLYTEEYEIKEKMDKIIDYINDTINSEANFDWINGCSSTLNLLIDIYNNLKDEKYYLAIMKHADKLLELLNSDINIHGGFAHGASAIAMVLFKTYKLLKIENYKIIAQKLLDIDRSKYYPDKKAWISFDDKSNSSEIRHHWCHGTVGIGISRIEMKKYYNDDILNEEINIATDLLFNNNINKLDILCHGNMGIADFFLNKYSVRKDINDFNIAKKLVYYCIKDTYSIKKIGKYTTLGLFNGLLGIGYQCLRLYNIDNIPSVLTLA